MDRLRIAAILEERKEPAFRSKQIAHACYREGVSSWQEATALSASLREALASVPVLTLEPVRTVESKDGTKKVLFRLVDGKEIEAVLIANGDFRTVCVSSQVGCAMACSFCATGTLGLARNLTADEIVDQVVYFDRDLKKQNSRVSNVVFMGMGEPCANLDAVFTSIYTMNDEETGLGIGARKISISTCGIVPGINRITTFPLQINLAISLHAPTDDLRSELMPVNKAYSIGQVLDACRNYIRTTNRKLFVEYVMLRGKNDSTEQAGELAAVLEDFRPLVQVNLIPFHQSFFSFQPTVRQNMERFQAVLEESGIPTTIRHSAGVDIMAACGQLARDTKAGS